VELAVIIFTFDQERRKLSFTMKWFKERVTDVIIWTPTGSQRGISISCFIFQ